jgi:hypothetical protein
MTREQILQRIKDTYPEYSEMDDDWLYNFALERFPEYKEDEEKAQYVSERQYKIAVPNPDNLQTEPQHEHWYDFLKKGYNDSLTGIAHSIVSGEQAFDLQGRDFNSLEEIGAGIASFFMPIDVLTFLVPGSTAAKLTIGGVRKSVTTKLVANGLSREMAEKVSTRAVNRHLKQTAPSLLKTGVASVQGGTGFGAFQSGHSILADKQAEVQLFMDTQGKEGTAPGVMGLVTPFGVDWSKAGVEFVKGYGKGTILAGTGAATSKILGQPVSQNVLSKSARKGVEIATETLGLATGERLIEGTPVTQESLIHTLGTVVGLKGIRSTVMQAKDKMHNELMNKERLKKEYLKLLDKVSPDKDSNKLVLEKLKELESENNLTLSKIKELNKLLDSGELDSVKTPEQPIRENIKKTTSKEKVGEAETILSEKISKDKYLKNWKEKLNSIESEIQNLKKNPRKNDADKKRLTLLNKQKQQLSEKINKRASALQSPKKVGIQVEKLEKTEKKSIKEMNKKHKKESLEYEVKDLEYTLGLKEQVVQHLRRTLGIVDGDLSKASPKDLYNYKKWVEKNAELSLRDKASDSIIRKEVVKKLGVKEFDKLGFFTKMALPSAKVIEKFGGGPGKIVSEKLYAHFFDSVTQKATGNYYRRQMTSKLNGLGLNTTELDMVTKLHNKEMFSYDKLSTKEKKWYRDANGRGRKGDADYLAPNKDSKAYKAKEKYQDMMNSLFDQWVEAVVKPLKTKGLRDKVRKKLRKDRYVEDYVQRVLTPEARKWAISNKFGFKDKLEYNILKQLEAENLKLPKNQRLSQQELKSSAGSVINDIVNGNSYDNVLFNVNFDMTRKAKLPNVMEMQVTDMLGNKKMKEIKIFDTSFQNVETYTQRMSHYVSTIKHFRDYTNVDRMLKNKYGIKMPSQGEGYAKNILNDMGKVSQKLQQYSERTIKKQLLGDRDLLNDPWYRGLKSVTAYVGWTGLTSPFTGMKNWLLADVHNFTAYGFRGLMRSYTALIDPKMWNLANKVNAFEVGGTLWKDAGLSGKITKYNPGLMTIAENANRIRSVAAGHYVSQNAAYVLQNKTASAALRKIMTKDYAYDLFRNTFQLGEKDIRLIERYGLDSRNPSVVSSGQAQNIININKKIAHYSHINTQGATSPAFLPLWSSGKTGRSMTLFYRMAYRAGVNVHNNVYKPLAGGNPFPMLRYISSSLVGGEVMNGLYKNILGRISGTEIADKDRQYAEIIENGFTMEILGPFTNVVEDFNGEAGGLLDEVAIFRQIQDFTSLIIKLTTGNERKDRAFEDYLKDTIVFFNHAEKVYQNKISTKPEHRYLVNHKQIRKYVDFYSKNRDPASWEDNKYYREVYTERHKFQKDLQDAFYTGNEQEMANAFWSSVMQLTHQYKESNQYTGSNGNQFAQAYIDAHNEIIGSVKRFRPVDLALNDRGGKIISKYNEFMLHVKKTNPDVFLQINETEEYYMKRLQLLDGAIRKYNKNDLFISDLKEFIELDKLQRIQPR